MFERFDRGVTAIRSSGRLFTEHPSLAVLPLLSLGTVGTAYAALGLVLVRYDLVADLFASNVLQYGALFVALSISSVAGIFFNAAIVHCAAQYFRGETPSARDGLRRAWTVRSAVVKWGLLSATIGTALAIVEDNVPGVGSLTRSVLDLAWGLLTFFVVPVIVLEEPDSLRSGLRRSGGAFKRTWGESVTAVVGIGVALLPVGLVGAALLGYAYVVAGGAAAYAIGLLGGMLIVSCVVVSQILGMVVRTALYRYATTDDSVALVDELGPDDVFPDD